MNFILNKLRLKKLKKLKIIQKVALQDNFIVLIAISKKTCELAYEL